MWVPPPPPPGTKLFPGILMLSVPGKWSRDMKLSHSQSYVRLQAKLQARQWRLSKHKPIIDLGYFIGLLYCNWFVLKATIVWAEHSTLGRYQIRVSDRPTTQGNPLLRHLMMSLNHPSQGHLWPKMYKKPGRKTFSAYWRIDSRRRNKRRRTEKYWTTYNFETNSNQFNT